MPLPEYNAIELPVRGNHFAAPGWRQVLIGDDSRRRVLEALDQTQSRRTLILTSPSVSAGPFVREAEALLGYRWAATYTGCRPHSPVETVFEAAEIAVREKVDSLLVIGGSSVIDTSKAVALVVANRLENEDALLAYVASPSSAGIGVASRMKQRPLVQVALTTTMAASEFSGVAGITHKSRNAKLLYADRGFFFDSIILDPALTLGTPEEIWLSSGIKLLDNTIEQVCSRGAQPVTTTLSMEAMKLLPSVLRASKADPKAIDPRRSGQYAAWLTVLGSHNAWAGIGAALRHQLGATFNIVHGHASSILVPHVLRYVAPDAGTSLVAISRALGSDDPEGGPEAYRQLAIDLGLPTRLRDIGVPHASLPDIARGALKQFVAQQTLRPIDEASTIAILEAAW